MRYVIEEPLEKSFIQEARKIINASRADHTRKNKWLNAAMNISKLLEDYDGHNQEGDIKDSKETHKELFDVEDELMDYIQSIQGEEDGKEGELELPDENEEAKDESIPVPPIPEKEALEEKGKPVKKEKKPEEEEVPVPPKRKAKTEEIKKSGAKCPFDGKQGVYLRRYYQSPYWIREFKCPRGHIFQEVQ